MSFLGPFAVIVYEQITGRNYVIWYENSQADLDISSILFDIPSGRLDPYLNKQSHCSNCLDPQFHNIYYLGVKISE